MPGPRTRLGIMGGTFDPIHNGHLWYANEVGRRLRLDEVLFVPAGQPWQKDLRGVSVARHRYAMTAIATASNPLFSVSRIEVDRSGPTYTVDTLRKVREMSGPDLDLFFILGADCLAQILTWRDAHSLFALAHFIGCSRLGYELSAASLPEGRVSLLEVSDPGISSTAIRRRVGCGAPIAHLVPDGVSGYIARHDLYRTVGTRRRLSQGAK